MLSSFDESSVLFVSFGSGIGYHLEFFLKLFSGSGIKVIAVEPDEELISFPGLIPIRSRLCSMFAEKGSELSFLPVDSAIEIIKRQKGKVSFFCHPFYYRHFRERFDHFIKSVQQNLPAQSLNRNTKEFFARTWLRNYFINLDLLKAKKFTLLSEQTFSTGGKDVVYAGASPDIETQTGWIKKNRESVFLISSDTASFYLLSQEIKPDLIISIDSGRGTIFHFREELPVDIPILTWLGANSRIFSIPNPLILYFSTYPFDQLFAEFASKEECILSNESLNLAGIAKSLSIFLNKKKLILLGTSFLAKNGKTHCRGTGYENFRIPSLGRKQTMEGYIPRIYGKKLSHKNKLAYDKLMSQQGELIVENFSEMNTAVTLQNKYLPVQLKFNQEADAEIVERFSVNLPSFLYDPVFAGRVSEELSLNKPVINRLRKLICKE